MGPGVFSELQKIILAVVLVISSVFLLLIILLTLPYRLLVHVLAKLYRPDLGPMITDLSSVFSSEKPEEAIFNMVYFAIIDGHMSTDRFRQLFNERILNYRNSRGELVYYRMREGWDYFLGYTFWRPDKNFHINYYIRDYDYDGELKLPSPCYEEDLRRVCGGLNKVHWERGRSGWEAILAHNYRVPGDPKPKTVLVARHQHTTIDGYSLVELMRRLFQTDYPLSAPNFPEKPLWLKLLYPIILPFKIPYDLAENLLDSMDPHSQWHLDNDKTRNYITCFPKPIHADRIKSIKNKYQASYAAVAFAGICGGIYRVLREAGRPIPDSLATLIPVPKPNHPGGAVNHVLIINTRWQIQADSPLQRLRKLQSNLDKLKYSTVPIGGDILIPALGLLPTALRKFIVYNGILKGATVIASSFPVTMAPIYFDGFEIIDLIPCTGTFGRKIGTAFLMAGINGQQRVTVNIDRKVFPEEEIFRKLGDYIDEELENLENSSCKQRVPDPTLPLDKSYKAS